ncbi:hypothetical protein [Bdellovibrio sp. GT3]|uniref:hypothetical protein n=1 Tax=Bdellovibrio sp. GT3 TaxID=3136282 RepID=UPI0030F2D365
MCDQAPKFNGMQRRQLLAALLGAGATVMLAGCNQTGFSPLTTSSDSDDSSGSTGGSCVESANETNGPFPADGSNTAGDGTSTRLDKVYTGSPIIRRDIGESFSGVPLTLNISLQNVRNSCATLPNYYIYIWHCTPAGVYSAYTASNNGGSHSSSETYFRGIQQTDSNGEVTFTTIYPGWYTGRAIHIHAEVYAGLDDASPIKIAQFAFPMSVNRTVAAQTTYGYKGTSGMMDNSADGIFSDGTSTEMLTVSANSSTGGYTASIAVRVSV